MPTLIVIDHGSRRGEANALSEQLTESLARALAASGPPGTRVHLAHLEAAPPSLAEVIDACVAEGAREVIVQPLFLFPGRHARVDIPQLMEAARARHPQLRLQLGEVIGADPDFVALLVDRFVRSLSKLPASASLPPGAEATAGTQPTSESLKPLSVGFDSDETELLRRIAARRQRSLGWVVREMLQPALREAANKHRLKS